MDKATVPGLFVNDGSFLERFKQLQQEKDKKNEVLDSSSKSVSNTSLNSAPKIVIAKTKVDFKRTSAQDTTRTPSGGKLAFILKQKSKLVSPPVNFEEDEDEDKENGNSSDDAPVKRAKLDQMGSSEQSSEIDNVPHSPSDPTVKKVAEKLASFVAKNGRQFEHVTRQKNPGDTPFKFLYDSTCSDYKYYEYRLSIEEKELSKTRESQSSQNDAAPRSSSSSQRSHHQQSKFQTPAPALYETSSGPGILASIEGGKYVESAPPSVSDPIAMMEYYMKKAAQEEKRRPPKASKDEMPPPESVQAPMKGHHMGDYIPPEELEKFLATCNDVSAQKYAKEVAEKAKIQADNVGHRLLSKMGWKEGEGLGSSRSGISDPIMAGDVKKDNLGIGAHAPGEVAADDDIYEQYKKRMMLGYRYRPNPLNNPRKAYY